MNNIENAPESPEVPQRPVRSFKTSKGSIYTYDEDRKTTRFKTATGEQHMKQDITVFVDLTPEEDQEVNNAYHHIYKEYEGSKVYVLERQQDNTPRIIRDITDVKDPERLYLAVFRNGERCSLLKKASLSPIVGYHVFDSRHFEKDGQWYTERHLGHKVAEIEYE